VTTIPRAESDITPAWLTAVSLIQMAGAVNLGGGIAVVIAGRLASLG